jgi:hypothetical protein
VGVKNVLENQQLRDMSKWAGFVGIMTIISGVLGCLTIAGIIPGIISIILGLKLRSAKKYADELAADPNETTQSGKLNLMISDLSGYFKIQGILIIVGLVLAVVGIIIAIAAGAFFAANAYNYY